MRALLPPGVENAALDVVAYLASAVFTMDQARSLKEESAPPRLINVDDYKKVYNALGVTDALPAGTDFARQNWVSTTLTGANLIARAYFLNQKLQGALGPTCGFLAGERSHPCPISMHVCRLHARQASQPLPRLSPASTGALSPQTHTLRPA